MLLLLSIYKGSGFHPGPLCIWSRAKLTTRFKFAGHAKHQRPGYQHSAARFAVRTSATARRLLA